MSGAIGQNPLVLYNWDPASQLAGYYAAQAAVSAQTVGARAKIVAIGDSTTVGYGGATTDYRDTASYPFYLAQALTAAGVPAQTDNFLGGGQFIDGRISLTGDAVWAATDGAGGPFVETQATGSALIFTLTNPGAFDHLDISYADVANGSITVSVDGAPPLATLQFGNTGKLLTQTLDLPLGTYSSVQITAATSNPVFIEGAAFSNSVNPEVEVYNAGVGGAFSDTVRTGVTSAIGEIPGVVGLSPNLVLIDYGINDLNQQLIAPDQTAANVAQMVEDFQAEGIDSIIVVPTPFGTTPYLQNIGALRADLEAVSNALDVPIIDLSATYDDDYQALADAGLTHDLFHPDAALYSIIGSQIAAVLASGAAPAVTMAPAPAVASGGAVTLGEAAAPATDPLSVQLMSDAMIPSGSSISLQGRLLSFTPGLFNSAAAGSDAITYTVTDTVTGFVNTESQVVTLVACYCRGTRVATTRGDVAVEALRIGDRVITVSGLAEPIRWIGRRSYAKRLLSRMPHLHPVRIAASALADGVPARPLIISPKHAVAIDGVLIAAADLVNGRSIAPVRDMQQVDYFHIELTHHDIILAEGAPSETFVDDDSRAMFHNAAEFAALYPDARPAEAQYCRPRLTQGPQLQAVRDRLAARAGVLAQAA